MIRLGRASIGAIQRGKTSKCPLSSQSLHGVQFSLHKSCRCLIRRRQKHLLAASAAPESSQQAVVQQSQGKLQGPSADFSVIWGRLLKLGLPYWSAEGEGGKARWKLAGVLALTLGTTGVSVLFNFLGRDFFNALSEKDVDRFYQMLVKWVGALFLGIPVFVMRDFFQSSLSLDWRNWMTREITADYFSNRAFYQVQAGDLVDNPDQRIASDARMFTETALSFSTGLLNAFVDLVSFSGILYTIYPPLFVALLIYSIGGTAISLRLGRPLVGLNFQQEAREADFRYGLVRVRENAESIAFYGGEASEMQLLYKRVQRLVDNAFELIKTERNLQFFTSFYRFLISILPAAVVAPLYFQGKIEFGVVNQSSSAFNHILSDVSLIVFQFESIAGFGAIIDRLGQFAEVLEPYGTSPMISQNTQGSEAAEHARADVGKISLEDVAPSNSTPLLELQSVSLRSPDGTATLVNGLSLEVGQDETLLIVGPSGAGKTSILRAIAGLWTCGSGKISRYGQPISAGSGNGDILFVPQRPYVVLGSLREQLLYPLWSDAIDSDHKAENGAKRNGATPLKPLPSDAELEAVLKQVRLGLLLDRESRGGNAGAGLDSLADWGGILSLGEQQRLAFARILLTKPRIVLMDESTSALDTDNEALLYEALQQAGIRYVSVGHRPTLSEFHTKVLRLSASAEAEQGGAPDRDSPQCTWEVSVLHENEKQLTS